MLHVAHKPNDLVMTSVRLVSVSLFMKAEQQPNVILMFSMDGYMFVSAYSQAGYRGGTAGATSLFCFLGVQ